MLTGDSFADIAKRRFTGTVGSVSKITVEKKGKVVVNYINQKVLNAI